MGGRKNVESGHIQSLGRSGVGGRIGGHRGSHEDKVRAGLIGGRRTAETRTHEECVASALRMLENRDPEKAAARARELGRRLIKERRGIFSPAVLVNHFANSSAGGKRFVALHGSPATPEGCRKGGIATVRKSKKNKTGLFGLTRERLQEASRKGAHSQWHVARGLSSDYCVLCQQLPKAA